MRPVAADKVIRDRYIRDLRLTRAASLRSPATKHGWSAAGQLGVVRVSVSRRAAVVFHLLRVFRDSAARKTRGHDLHGLIPFLAQTRQPRFTFGETLVG
ncbi:MAG: hypothetical protein ACQESR_14390 [Planctomycetota bacterium]